MTDGVDKCCFCFFCVFFFLLLTRHMLLLSFSFDPVPYFSSKEPDIYVLPPGLVSHRIKSHD